MSSSRGLKWKEAEKMGAASPYIILQGDLRFARGEGNIASPQGGGPTMGMNQSGEWEG
jgi:hypothetical protein